MDVGEVSKLTKIKGAVTIPRISQSGPNGVSTFGLMQTLKNSKQMKKEFLKSVILSVSAILLAGCAIYAMILAMKHRLSGLDAGTTALCCFIAMCWLVNLELNRKPFNQQEGGNQ